MTGYRDWDHTAGQSGAGGGVCFSSDDCRINNIRSQIHDDVDSSVDPHEPCWNGRCQSLWLNFQGTRWGKADATGSVDARLLYEPGVATDGADEGQHAPSHDGR